MTLKIIDSDNSEWLDYYQKLDKKQQDVFYHPGFAKACQNGLYKKHQVKCAVWEYKNGTILYPFVLRNFLQYSYMDITGLYGRGGIAQDIDDINQINKFYSAFSEYCLKAGIVCSFDRYHPILENHLYADHSSKLINIGKFIVLDLNNSIEQIEREYKHNHRKSIKKAERSGITFFFEDNLDHLDEFINIYKLTLIRNNADDFYYFEKEFYEGLYENLQGKFIFYYAVADGKVISCELVLFDKLYAHSFLGGTLLDYMQIGANVFLKKEIIRDLKKRKISNYCLGGGVQKDDGIYKYKLWFAPNGAISSYIGGVVYDLSAYNNLKIYMDSQNISFDSNRIQFYDQLVDL